jgi:hypothetical protein
VRKTRGDQPAPKLSEADPKSFRWLVQEYKISSAYLALADRTRKVRAAILDDLCEHYGDLPYALLTAPAVMRLRDQRADKPEAANARIKAIRQVYRYALEYQIGGVTADPTRDLAFIKSRNPDGFHAWSTEEIAILKARTPQAAKRAWLWGSCFMPVAPVGPTSSGSADNTSRVMAGWSIGSSKAATTGRCRSTSQ